MCAFFELACIWAVFVLSKLHVLFSLYCFVVPLPAVQQMHKVVSRVGLKV